MSIYYIDNNVSEKTDDELDIWNYDPSLNGKMSGSLENKFALNINDFNRLFFSKYKIDYISKYFSTKGQDLRVLTHPYKTNTCFEKAEILGMWDPLNVIKVFYFENVQKGLLYAVVIPETGCFIDKRKLKDILCLPEGEYIRKAKVLPQNMTYGTCSPFVLADDLKANGGKVEKIIFDTETLVIKKMKRTLDDFSFGLDHRLSVQMNYYDCFRMLKRRYSDLIVDEEVLNLSFKEKLIREKGTIKIAYEFNTLNYRTAQFINSIHGYGDVSITNDHIDELDLPEILMIPKNHNVKEG